MVKVGEREPGQCWSLSKHISKNDADKQEVCDQPVQYEEEWALSSPWPWTDRDGALRGMKSEIKREIKRE